jgi:hypothetical protein
MSFEQYGTEGNRDQKLDVFRDRINSEINDLYAEVTGSPVEFPNRNLIRRLLSAAADLASTHDEGEQITRQAAAEKLREVLAIMELPRK